MTPERYTGTELAQVVTYLREHAIGNATDTGERRDGMELLRFEGLAFWLDRAGDYWIELDEERTPDDAIDGVLRRGPVAGRVAPSADFANVAERQCFNLDPDADACYEAAQRERRTENRPGEALWEGSPINVELLALPINHLLPHEVFVFGSNAAGLHGAGAAGHACRGDARNTWRSDEWFLRALRAPAGDSVRVGRWAVLGTARGPQHGWAGSSYAIQTIQRAGARRSTSRREIYEQLVQLVAFARSRPDLVFVVTPLGEGYAGYSRDEMAIVWRELHKRVGVPDSFSFIRMAHGG